MSQQEAISNFITSLALHFTVKHETPEHEKAWLRSMAINLKSFPAAVLNEAADEIIRTRKHRNFPLPAECREVCIAIDKRERAELPIEETVPERHPEWTKWRIRNADMMIQSGLGREAAQSNWILQLHDFIRVNQRLPKDHEITRLKEQARLFDEAYEECVRGGWEQAAMLERLGAAMLAKREKLMATAMGETR
ncbi:hypothetical protein [Aquamicrobium sp.]|uniref:hypothetical protein n=1 Tax=Aquamicrobium sp. TaxID=1872579 RepID=UPI0025856FBA|nr:hypothetical protein [Aquamicrobium sp.]MCK9549187.1 hypothetical protein [Aquamicrobium sp.]